VGQLKPNGWGLYDMLGNVWQWTDSWYGDYPDHAVVDPVPLRPAKNTIRVARGGSWNSPESECRAAYRNGCWEPYRDDRTGFRVALDVQYSADSSITAVWREPAKN
jgi:formylglycine-generating enzyme required for sulfatase activity